MYKHRSHNKIIEGKLEELPGADTDALWSNMEAILDKKMPQKKKRPGILGWFFTNKGGLLLSIAVSVSVVGFSLVQLSNNKPVAANRLSPANTSTKKNTTSTTQPAAVPNHTSVETDAVTAPAAPETVEAPAVSTEEKVAVVLTTTPAKPATIKAEVVGNEKWNGVSTQEAAAPLAKQARAPVEEKVQNAITDQASTIPAIVTTEENSRAVNSIAISHEDHIAEAASQALLNNIIPDSTALVSNTVLATLLREAEATAAAAAAQKRARIASEKGPYIGLMVGVDMSSVQFQSLKAGSNKGLVLGYAFNNRLSVESGLYWDKKKYVAKGEDFKPDGYTPDPNTTILKVTGVNTMYEWPVNVKYTVLPGRHKLFVTAGVSSYFMKDENYNYEYEQNGQLGTFYASYKNQTKNWLSIANFSLGYTHKLGGIGSIRVEPYVKLPIGQLGIGNMRVMSTGVNVGLTRPLRL